MQTPEGREKALETNIAKYGSYEAYREALRGFGAKGGKQKVPKGFNKMDKKRHLAISKAGFEIRKKKLGW